jgi:hypothetical protein
MTKLSNNEFDLKIDNGAIVSLKRVNDAFDTDYIAPESRFCDVVVKYRSADSDWKKGASLDLANAGSADITTEGDTTTASYDIDKSLALTVKLDLQDNALLWLITLENKTNEPLEIGDIAMPFPMNSAFVWDPDETCNLRVFRHDFISGHNSHIYWMRPNTVAPYLLMTPLPGTWLEYWDQQGDDISDNLGQAGFHAYIHSAGQVDAIDEHKGSWRQPHTSRMLAPAGQADGTCQYGFKFEWTQGYDEIRDALHANGLMDIHVVPGMTVPEDLFAMFSIRTKHKINAITAEHPDQTKLEYLGEEQEDTHVYRVAFKKLGENLLSIEYGDGLQAVLEFFATEPVETMLNKRSAFLVDKCQHKDPSQWWNGLVSDWNMTNHVLLDPEHLDMIKGWRQYMASCDDPGLGKVPFIAAKNVELPVQAEIEAIDYYIDNFVWGGLQMTEDEPYPFGIYGIPNWKVNRESEEEGAKGKLHVWRIYDYPHIILLYFKMYEIANLYPDMKTSMSATDYLRRAAGTAKTFFTTPYEIREWSAYKTGLYNELIIPDVITALRSEDMAEDADVIKEHWENKVRFFVNEKSSPYGSEYPFDSTGFESTHAFAKYAYEQQDNPDNSLGVTREKAHEFMEMQTQTNLCCRGWLQPAYYLLGSDYRRTGGASYTLSYMAQMGGWSLLDYVLYRTDDPLKLLRVAYASSLSSWALINSGTPESNYGYWFPGEENDGGAGGGFEPAAYGTTWLEQPHGRGSWYYGCEIELGFSGGIRCARTILAEDPLFGLFAFGGALTETNDSVEVIPRDGVNRLFHVIRGSQRFHMILDRDRYASDKPIILNDDLSRISFTLQNVASSDHTTTLSLEGLPDGNYSLTVDGVASDDWLVAGSRKVTVEIAAKGDSLEQAIMISKS